MRYTHSLWTTLLMVLCLMTTAGAQDPGTPFSAVGQNSDQKAGSLLVYNIHTSNAAAPNAENTRVSITNTNDRETAYVHLYFVDGSSCSVADSFVCLTPRQTASFLASDLDPGVTGYVIAMTVNRVTGCPQGFNFLIGDEFVKFASGHAGNLGAEAFSAGFNELATCVPNETKATVYFDFVPPSLGDDYNFLPRVLALDSLPSLADGNSTMLIINRIGGDLSSRAATLSGLFGLLYDDQEKNASFSLTSGTCQFRGVISTTFPRTTPRVNQMIPSGRTGWLRLWADDPNTGILGAALNFNNNVANSSSAFTGGRNLHKLRINTIGFASANAPSLVVPVVPPSC